jgi:hypothetical protein
LKHDGERLESARPVRIISAILPDGKDQPGIHAGLFHLFQPSTLMAKIRPASCRTSHKKLFT